MPRQPLHGKEIATSSCLSRGLVRAGLFVFVLPLLPVALAVPAQAQFVCDSTTPGGAAGATAPSGFSVACGTNAAASGFSSTAFGNGSTATGTQSLAVGRGSQATGAISSTAVGAFSVASGSNSTAIGDTAAATGDASTAMGRNATASHANSAAFGANATTTRDNQQVFGTASNTYTMAGITSAESRTAQGAATHLVTSNASGDLAAYTFAELGLASSGDLTAINNRLDSLNSRFDSLNSRINDVDSRMRTGVAMAIAMGGAPGLAAHETFAVTMNWGTFEGANGTAINAALRLADNIQLNAGFGYGPDEKIAAGRAGVRFAW